MVKKIWDMKDPWTGRFMKKPRRSPKGWEESSPRKWSPSIEGSTKSRSSSIPESRRVPLVSGWKPSKPSGRKKSPPVREIGHLSMEGSTKPRNVTSFPKVWYGKTGVQHTENGTFKKRPRSKIAQAIHDDAKSNAYLWSSQNVAGTKLTESQKKRQQKAKKKLGAGFKRTVRNAWKRLN